MRAARELDIPRSTVRDWDKRGFDETLAGPMRQGPADSDEAFERAIGTPAAYAYLLGQYLGEGTIDQGKNGVYKIRFFCCSHYPGITGRVVATARAVLPRKVSAAKVRTVNLVVVTSHSNQLPRLFPQHGPGRKHERPIVLVDWQEEIRRAHPERFLRGLIESDGCRTINRVNGGEYPRYVFADVSDDIRRLFTRTCDQLGVPWTTANARNIAVSRRPDVAYLDSFIGPKW